MEFIKKGKESFRLGMECDEIQKYEEALAHYQRGIHQFITGIRYVKRENFKVLNRDRCIFAFPNERLTSERQFEMKNKIVEAAVEKCKMFLSRAELIKEHLRKTNPEKYPTSKKKEEEEEEVIVDNNNNKKKPKPEEKEEQEGEGELTKEQKMLRNAIEDSILKEKPNVKWSDVAGNHVAKRALEEAIVLPRNYPQLFVGKRKPWKCVLLYGPPGTGKTYLAKALATRMGDEVNFFSVSSSSLVSKWLGESEKLVRTLFEMAIREAPSVIFIDEIDSLAGKRGDSNEHESSRRMKTEFFVQIQKLMDSKANVVLLAATNRPFDLDSAMRRRFEKRIYIPLPDFEARMGVLKVHAGKEIEMELEEVREFARLLDGYSCSDIAICVRDALMQPVRKAMKCKRFKKLYDDDDKKKLIKITPVYNIQKEDEEDRRKIEFVDMNLLTIDNSEAHALELPRASVADLKDSIAKNKPSVNEEDLRGHEEFTEKFGQDG